MAYPRNPFNLLARTRDVAGNLRSSGGDTIRVRFTRPAVGKFKHNDERDGPAGNPEYMGKKDYKPDDQQWVQTIFEDQKDGTLIGKWSTNVARALRAQKKQKATMSQEKWDLLKKGIGPRSEDDKGGPKFKFMGHYNLSIEARPPPRPGMRRNIRSDPRSSRGRSPSPSQSRYPDRHFAGFPRVCALSIRIRLSAILQFGVGGLLHDSGQRCALRV